MRDVLVELYGLGKPPGEWRSIAGVAAELGVTPRICRRLFNDYGITPRTPAENIQKVALQAVRDPEFYPEPERLARTVIEAFRFEIGKDCLHNHWVGRTCVGFFFPTFMQALEIESVWSRRVAWRRRDHAEQGRLRDARLLEYGIETTRIEVETERDAWQKIGRFFVGKICRVS